MSIPGRGGITKRIEQGNVGVIGTLDGNIPFHGWLGFGEVHVSLLNRSWAIPENGVFFYNFYTAEVHGGRNILPLFLSRVKNYCLAKGVVRSPGVPLNVYFKLLGTYAYYRYRYWRVCGIRLYAKRKIKRSESRRAVTKEMNRADKTPAAWEASWIRVENSPLWGIFFVRQCGRLTDL